MNVILQFRSYFVKESRKQIVPFHPVITESFSFPWFAKGNSCRVLFSTVAGASCTAHHWTPIRILVLHNSRGVLKN